MSKISELKLFLDELTIEEHHMDEETDKADYCTSILSLSHAKKPSCDKIEANNRAKYYASILTAYHAKFLNYDILPEGVIRIKQEYAEWDKASRSDWAKGSKAVNAAKHVLRIAIECCSQGIKFLPADINKSDDTRFILEDGHIRIPYNWYRGLDPELIDRINIEKMTRPFSSRADFKKRLGLTDRAAGLIWGETVGLGQ